MQSTTKPKTGRKPPVAATNDYSAPALEKGLDILELIAAQKGGLLQSQIASALNRSIQEIYRMLSCLERRGYIYRARPSDLYFLSMKLFEIAHHHAPTEGLLQIALPRMRALADDTQQSCNLGIHSASRVLVLAQVESPGPFSFSVRPGALFPLLPNAAGRVLLAFQEPAVQDAWMEAAGARDLPAKEQRALVASLASIRESGFADMADATVSSRTISYPVLGNYGHAIAVLTVPYIAAVSFGTQPVQEVHAKLKHAADSITAALTAKAGAGADADAPRPG